MKRLAEEKYQNIIIVFVLIVIYISSSKNYLLFHSLVEVFSICIAFAVFFLTINALKYKYNNYMVILGTAYFFIGTLDLIHTLSYKGMNIFTDYDYYANQIWIATRYFESIVLVIAFFSVQCKRKIHVLILMSVYTVITAAIIGSIFLLDIFPKCFVEGIGQTTFKIYSEYIIVMILTFSLLIVHRNRKYFKGIIYRYLIISVLFTMLSELSFTFYIDHYGISNLVGHYFKIISFYFIYKACTEICLKQPYERIFDELSETKALLKEQKEQLQILANKDPLTGLYNHTYMYNAMGNEIKRFIRYGSSFYAMVIDIDEFKHINDKYGHTTGDHILKHISLIIHDHIRETDMIGRYGGDEFLVILLQTNIDDARKIGNKIRDIIYNTKFEKDIRCSVSIGLGEYKKGDAKAFLDSVDKKLNDAKKEGSNRVVC